MEAAGIGSTLLSNHDPLDLILITPTVVKLRGARRQVVTGRSELDFSLGVRLALLPNRDLHNPVWVVGATLTMVDGHNGIFGHVFVDFVFHLVASHAPQQAG